MEANAENLEIQEPVDEPNEEVVDEMDLALQWIGFENDFAKKDLKPSGI
jgi:hypothetical protein